MLIQSRGLVARFRDCARDERGDNMTAAVRIVVFRFFGDDDEQAVFFEQSELLTSGSMLVWSPRCPDCNYLRRSRGSEQ